MVISKFSLFVFLLRFCYLSFYSFISYWQFYSLLIATISIFVGAVAGLKQRRLKSLLTYSAINNTHDSHHIGKHTKSHTSYLNKKNDLQPDLVIKKKSSHNHNHSCVVQVPAQGAGGAAGDRRPLRGAGDRPGNLLEPSAAPRGQGGARRGAGAAGHALARAQPA